jgi:hypothetical protein
MTDEQRRAEIEAGKRAGEEVRRETRALLEDAGINLSYLIGKLQDELNAYDTKMFAHQGEIGDTRDVIAWDVRQRARQDAHKLRGDYPAEKQEVDTNLHIEVTNYSNTILNKNGASEVDSDCGKEAKVE